MIKSKMLFAVLASGWAVTAASGCAGGKTIMTYDDGTPVGDDLPLLPAAIGSARLALSVGANTIDTVTAVLSCGPDFEPEVRTIDVSDRDAVVSIFFGNLAVGHGYNIELTGGSCRGSATFSVEADQTTPVTVAMICDSQTSEPAATGNADIRATFAQASPEPSAACSHVASIVAAPSIQQANGPQPVITVVLNDGATPTQIRWSTATDTGGTGSLGALSSTTDPRVTFDCTSSGKVDVVADVTSVSSDGSCAEEARATVECRSIQ